MTAGAKNGRMNRWDSMLAWLSSKSEHKWHNVKTAGQRLSAIEFPDKEWSPLRHAMEWAGVLIRLGHAEFDSEKRVVTAISPGLLTSESSNKAILYGYWSPSKRQLLRRMAPKRWYHTPPRGPTCYAVSVAVTQLSELTESLSVWSTPDCSVALLKRLPKLSQLTSDLQPSQVSGGGYWERFDYISNSYGRWRSCDSPLTQPGLYQRKEGRAIQLWVDDKFRQFSLQTIEEKLAAKWWVYEARFDWVFDARRRVLLIPDETPDLPVLVSRGLTMRSARLPTRILLGRRRWRKYGSVGIRHAEEAARIMEQTLVARSLEDV